MCPRGVDHPPCREGRGTVAVCAWMCNLSLCDPFPFPRSPTCNCKQPPPTRHPQQQVWPGGSHGLGRDRFEDQRQRINSSAQGRPGADGLCLPTAAGRTAGLGSGHWYAAGLRLGFLSLGLVLTISHVFHSAMPPRPRHAAWRVCPTRRGVSVLVPVFIACGLAPAFRCDARFTSSGVQWDTSSATPWYAFKDPVRPWLWWQGFYDDARSLRYKVIRFARPPCWPHRSAPHASATPSTPSTDAPNPTPLHHRSDSEDGPAYV